MTNATDASWLAFAHRLADASGAAIRPHFRETMAVEDKGTGRAGYDPVTVADREAERAIRALIRAEFPGHGILGEELGEQTGTEPWTWVIDPIDGTRAFICGMPVWGTLIALNDGRRPVLGLLDQPILGERFVGADGQARLVTRAGERVLRVRPCPELVQAVVTTTHPTAYFSPAERTAFARVEGRARMSRFGGDCYAYGMLAMGFLDCIIEASLKPFDVQALIPIVEGAGGVITDWRGGDPQGGGQVVAAGDPRLHAEVLALLSEAATTGK